MNIRASQRGPALEPLSHRAVPCTADAHTRTVGLTGQGRPHAARDPLKRAPGLDLHLRVVAESRRTWLDHENDVLDPHAPETRVWPRSHRTDVGLTGAPCPLLADCSASEPLATHHAQWLAAGIHVVPSSTLAVCGPLEHGQSIRFVARTAGAHIRHKATVGAGLPVVHT